MIGNEPYFRATCRSDCAFRRCCQSGVRCPGRRRGISSARDGVLAKARAEERRAGQLADHELLDLLGVDHQILGRRRRVGIGQVQCDPVVRPDRVHLDAERLAQASGERERPRRVHASAERRQQADAPVADLVAEALDHDGAVGRDDARRGRLLVQEREQVARGLLVERVLVAQPRERLLLGERDELARELPDRGAELVGAADALALPERHEAGHARGGRDEHAVAGDLLDPPRRGAEQERLTRARLVDHLLVQLADSPAAVHEVDAEQAAVGDRACVRDRELARAGAAADHACRAVPDDARPKLGELVGRVAAREHVEHVLELCARELGERVGAAHEPVQVVDGDLLVGGDRDDLLREHVERVARDDRLLDLAVEHAARDDRRLEQVGPELREDAPARDGAELMAGATDALQPARDRLRRLDLDHEVDRAHVDAELERRGRDQTRDASGLQLFLDDQPLLARERAVVRACDLLVRVAVVLVRVRKVVQA